MPWVYRSDIETDLGAGIPCPPWIISESHTGESYKSFHNGEYIYINEEIVVEIKWLTNDINTMIYTVLNDIILPYEVQNIFFKNILAWRKY